MKPGLALLAAAVVLAASTASGQASSPSRIVFSADRAPSVTGEVYRLDPNGRRVDLSKSPYQDVAPTVSSDGKRVAFISDRKDGKDRIYEVGITGMHLDQVGPVVAPSAGEICDETLAWQPGGTRLAAGSCGSGHGQVLVLQRGHKPDVVQGARNLMPSAQWSPDGRVLLAASGHSIVAANSQGKRLWTVKGARGTAVWSAQNLVAIPLKGSIAVYDSHGKRRFTAPGSSAFGPPAWSRDGGKLAVATGSALVVLSSTGQRLLQKPLEGSRRLVWNGSDEVVVGGYGPCGCKAKSVAVPTGKVSPASDRWFDPLSADGKLAIVTSTSDKGVSFGLGAAPPAGGAGKTYARVPGCWQYHVRTPAIGWQQLAGHSIVYESWGFCDEPYSNLYSVAADGGKPQRLTNAQAQQTQPALSPDESKIAYVWAKLTGISCSGCSDGIRVANADGSGERTLTNPQDCTFDDSPTWSPDGTTILFSETTCDTSGELFTIPASGGTPHDLGIAGSNPAWGPRRIAYVAKGVWTANPDGSDPVQVDVHGRLPAWSTSGALAYLVAPATVDWDNTPRKLPFTDVTSLAWSADGTQFIVVAKAKGSTSFDVYSVDTDGTHAVRLTTNYGTLGAWRG